jgi:hypothetical protein
MAIEPDQRQLAEVARRAAEDGDGTVVMLNLNRYRERAAYEDDVPGGYAAFLELVSDAELLAAASHRRAGLERAAVICCAPGARPQEAEART